MRTVSSLERRCSLADSSSPPAGEAGVMKTAFCRCISCASSSLPMAKTSSYTCAASASVQLALSPQRPASLDPTEQCDLLLLPSPPAAATRPFEAPLEAVCIAPFGLEEGTNVNVTTHQFGLVVGQPVKFKFFGSTIRREDVVGTHLDFWQPDDLEQLPDIEVTLDSANRNSGDVVPVSLSVTVTEVGTLKVEALASNSDETWEIELTVRQ